MFDLIIIGGGILGANLAWLARKSCPTWRILLLDKTFVGNGVTRYSAGLSVPIVREGFDAELVAFSDLMYRQLEVDVGVRIRHPLSLFWVVSSDTADSFRAQFLDRHPRRAVSSEIAYLKQVYPDLRIRPDEQVYAADDRAWYGFAHDTVQHLVRQFLLTDKSACYECVEVNNIEKENGDFVVTTKFGRKMTAARVVVATGPWMIAQETNLVGELDIRVKKVTALHLDTRPSLRTPAVSFPDEDMFLLPLLEKGYTLCSFYNSTWDCDPDADDLRLTHNDLRDGIRTLVKRSPHLGTLVLGGRAFCDAYTPNRAPLVKPASQQEALISIGGCSGSGFRLAPGIANRALNYLITGSESDTRAFGKKI